MSILGKLINRPLQLFGLRLARVKNLNSMQSRIDVLTRDFEATAREIDRSKSKPVELCPGQLVKPLPRSLTKRCLFIVGNARSGTTLLYTCLNQSPDVYLLGEANFYLHLQKNDFVGWYNEMQKGLGNYRGKDTWLPVPSSGNTSGVAVLKYLAQRHQWIGEKVAFGPHGNFTGRPNEEAFFEYQSRYFFDSTYLLPLRKPSEVVYSSKKLFVTAKIEEMIRSWLKSFVLQLDMYCSFPHTEWVFLEDLTDKALHQLAERLGTSLSLPEGTVCPGEQASSLDGDDVHPTVAKFGAVIRRMNTLYSDLRSTILEPHVRSTYSFRSFIERATELLNEVRPGVVKTQRIVKTVDTEAGKVFACRLPDSFEEDFAVDSRYEARAN